MKVSMLKCLEMKYLQGDIYRLKAKCLAMEYASANQIRARFMVLKFSFMLIIIQSICKRTLQTLKQKHKPGLINIT